ncbi:MAG: FAD:protein FMN transferase [Chloroflexi bacterium]|nr:FAD:protein FMN transferase [Chloroflexota bacterium]
MKSLPSYPSHTFRAMGSQIGLWLDAEPETAAAAFAQAEALFAFNERVLSRFLPESELSQVNGRAGEWVPVSDLLWNVVCDAVLQAEATQGLFDPTLLNALEAAGYSRSFELIAMDGTQAHPEQRRRINADVADGNRGNWQQIGLDADTQSIWLPPGLRLDLGGIGKGFTAQAAVELLAQWGPCLVDAGGDVTAGAAPRGLPGWPVAIAAPWTADAPEQANLLTLWLAESSLATSGIDYRYWQTDGRTAHHLIDPRTGQPARTDVLTVTIWAEQATMAEAWATAVLVQGSVQGWQSLIQQSHLAGVIITENEHLFMTESMQGFIAS